MHYQRCYSLWTMPAEMKWSCQNTRSNAFPISRWLWYGARVVNKERMRKKRIIAS